jgi:type I restriction enzyme S subunit
LRFPEFAGEWENHRLSDICTSYSGGTPLSSNRSYYNGNIPFIRSGEIGSDKTELFISETGLANSSAKLVEQGDLLIALYGATSGEIAISKLNGAINQAILCVSTTQNKEFLMYLWLSHKERILKSYLQGGQGNLSADIIKGLKFEFPHHDEQTKIATFLSLLDDRIATQSQIIKELESLMKGLSNKLFSQELRFKDAQGNDFPDWRAIKLRSVMSLPEKIKPAFVDKNKLLTVKLHVNGVSKNENTDTLTLGATNYFSRKKGQFIYGKQNLFNGAFGLVPEELDGFLSSADVPALDINPEKLNGKFLVYHFSRKPFYKKLESLAIGSGSKRIHETALLNIEIHLPTLEEQTKIAEFLSAIDEKIEIERQILNAYTAQKKYLLAKMFI